MEDNTAETLVEEAVNETPSFAHDAAKSFTINAIGGAGMVIGSAVTKFAIGKVHDRMIRRALAKSALEETTTNNE